ncbi:MAG: formylmethanofuran dehydrogenase subunit C [Gammaproteobacteria bacterium]|nr:formylmethanofuran dehydrogenase subunit C [Gammaproteobacteria bacterium]
MTALTFELKSAPEFPLDVSPLIPGRLQSMTLQQIRALRLEYGKQKTPVSTLFKVSGKDPNNIKIVNSTARIVSIGKGMESGRIEVSGDAGKFLGQGLKGGRISIEGNAGDWIGNRMTGGRIDIHGNAGDYVGASLPGDPFGMNNGFINITGNAGDRVGDRMRRGMIIIHGQANDFCGSRMYAGTIIVLKKAGRNTGTGMRRGSLILARKPAHISTTFRSCGNLKMQFLRLLFTQLAEIGEEFSLFRNFGAEAHRFSGDRARNGKGEILILQTIKSGTRK